MATGWLKGTVKAVPSGDSLLIMGSVKGGPPPEKTITLAGLIAPKLVRTSPSH
jgi:staphylococcal nuclease domain-containing protein 1